MKQLILLLLLFSLSFSAAAQVHRGYTEAAPNWQYMLTGGWQLTTLSQNILDTSPKAGWFAGLALKVPLRREWWLQPGLFFSSRSVSVSAPPTAAAPGTETAYTFRFTEIPLLLAYQPNAIVELQLGPLLGLLISNTSSATGGQGVVALSPADLRKWNLAGAAGIEINISPLAIGARYSYSFSSMAVTEAAAQRIGDGKLQGLQVYGALVF